jgi:hypothetical protein
MFNSQEQIAYAVDRWNIEVKSFERDERIRGLDITWREIIRRWGGDDLALLGPLADDIAEEDIKWEKSVPPPAEEVQVEPTAEE